jgi:2-oxoglutarate ferredoxin oxidoreductase subunit delta
MSKPEPAPGVEPKRATVAKAPPVIEVRVSWCKGCGLCVDYCNRGVLEMDGVVPKVIAAEKCTRCLQCEVICPDFAIEVRNGDENEQSPGETRG